MRGLFISVGEYMRSSKNIMGKLYALITLLILLLTTAILSSPVLFLSLLKLLPSKKIKIYCTKKVDMLATIWCELNNGFIRTSNPAKIEISGLNDFEPQNWYLVVANHQSWLDIAILQYLFNRKIPVLKFFIKDQLKWVPFLGVFWWAMGCPFMKRYSSAYLAKNPHKKGTDLQSTQKALEGFKHSPATLVSFIEGTRYTAQKKSLQKSPYQYLLKPKAGGISFVISAMNKQINHLLDVTITYPKSDSSLWDFLSHGIDLIKIHVRQITIPEQFLNSSLLEDEKTQSEFRQWLNQKWAEKDELIAEMKK